MIRCDHINTIIQHGLQNLLFVMWSFDRGVTFDFVAQSAIIFGIEPQMVNARFGCHEFGLAVREQDFAVFTGSWFKQMYFVAGGNV
ncbi:hypothetical protein D3C87_1887540 [compost metagenome]